MQLLVKWLHPVRARHDSRFVSVDKRWPPTDRGDGAELVYSKTGGAAKYIILGDLGGITGAPRLHFPVPHPHHVLRLSRVSDSNQICQTERRQ